MVYEEKVKIEKIEKFFVGCMDFEFDIYFLLMFEFIDIIYFKL